MPENRNTYDPASLPDLLPIYYKKLFPYSPYFRWLNYGGVPKTYLSQREFSFTLKDDIYIRYLSFSSEKELSEEIQKRCPYKIDIGAVFSHRPKEHKTVKAAAFQALEKELVFDIDMTDYDDVRSCCSGADICDRCWPLMQIAIKIIDRALRDDFGFEHLLWVYSGRRGVHCWVCDETARKLSQNGRTAIAEYLSVVKGGENQTKKVVLEDRPHPSIRAAVEIIKDRFKDYAVKKQDFLSEEEQIKKVLQLVPDEDFKENIEKNMEKFQKTKDRWLLMETFCNEIRQKNEFKKSHNITEEIMLQYCYPRLDVNVSKGVNHLLKSPFCIHPKTGRVCVPIDPENIDDFDPFTVPTISTIVDELNKSESGSEEGKRIKDYRQTSLKSCIEVFDKFLTHLEKTWKGKLIEQSDMKMEF
ncbi:DNA primase small subunit-like isoform X1 [Mercenaria mercenaria]|uniref:DNA primase small subunit-like isoform X1 n=1 Tax=Mercenaria mercenaria TaxID=6596 RepID=UPI00234F18CD|nr:DNA primase small subunit-like isoform X1 [Mercenaria mercenaria]